MRMSCYLLIALIALAVSALPAPAQDKTPPAEDKAQTADAKLKLAPYYAMLANAAEFDDAQRQKLAEVSTKRREAHEKWGTEEGPKVPQIKEAWVIAVYNQDDAHADKLRGILKELFAQRRQIDAEFAASLSGILKEEQRVPWETEKLFYNIKTGLGMKQVKLDDEQKTKARQMCLETAEAMSKLDPSDRKAQGKILLDFQQKMGKDLLTEEQQAQLKKPPPPPQAKKNAPPQPK